MFLKEIKNTFPELISPINREEGLSTFEMDVFYEFTQQNINDGEREIVCKCFEIANRYYIGSNNKFRNIIVISFIESLDFDNTKKKL